MEITKNKRKNRGYSRQRERRYVMMVIIPIVFLLLSILFYPMLSVFYYSVFDYNLMLSKSISFSGIDNYLRMTNDQLFYKSLGVSIIWVAMNIILQAVIGMSVALLLSKSFYGQSIVRTAILSPYAVSGVLASTLWLFIFHDTFGLLNDVLRKLGITVSYISWLSSPSLAIIAAVIAEVWRYTPFFIIILLAALQSVPQDLYEAAKVDGAGVLRRFGSITLPYIKETIVFTCILRAVWEFNSVDVLYTLTKGGPVNSTTTLAMYVVKTAINGSNIGYGSALTAVSFILLTVFTILFIQITRIRKGERLQ